MLSLSRVYQLSGRLSRRIHPSTLEVGDFYAKMLNNRWWSDIAIIAVPVFAGFIIEVI